jgi:uncharacterized protein involved in cysteine biosynthesis
MIRTVLMEIVKDLGRDIKALARCLGKTGIALANVMILAVTISIMLGIIISAFLVGVGAAR